jgi:DNA invertase Pin-like site-specific DNA recombinase
VIVDGYVRVSRVGDRGGESFISPAVQRDKIEKWAALRGVQIAAWHTDLDETGGKLSRPGLNAVMERIRLRLTDGVAVANLDRLSRAGVGDALKLVEEIHSHGGQLTAIDLGVDPTTPFGEFGMTVMLALARMERRRIAENWGTARKRAVARGVYAKGRPLGYRRRSDGRLCVHPIEGPIVTELFRRRAHGARIVELQSFLVEAGIKTANGCEWYSSSVRKLFTRRVYLGEVHALGVVNRCAHPALTDIETWEAVQLEHQRFPPRRASQTPLLRGILRCAGCRRLLRANARDQGSSRERRWYQCADARRDGHRCPTPGAISDARVDPYVEAVFWQEVEQPTFRPALRRLGRLREQVERRERELETYRDSASLPVRIGPRRFARGLDVRAERLELAKVQLSRAQAQADVDRLPPPTELRELWPAMSFEQRRAAIGEVIDCVFVFPGSCQPIESRLYVCLRGRGPTALPQDNPRQRIDLRPFDPSACPPSPTRRGGLDWPEGQVREELAQFLAGRDRWPCFREFQAAGRTTLWEQAERHGGERHWALRMSVHYDAPSTETGRWSEQRVRAELQTYVRGKTEWPSWREFSADGLEKLRRAVNWHGGAGRWASEFGLQFAPRRCQRKRWTDAHITDALIRFVGTRRDWPPRSEFQAAGLDRLYEVINRLNARERFASELGLHLPTGTKYFKKRWTDPAIKAVLDELVRERDTFPSYSDFRKAGLLNLYATLIHAGTRDDWARRYRLPLKRPKGESSDASRGANAPH